MNIQKCIGGYFAVINTANNAEVTFKEAERILKQNKIKPRKPTIHYQANRKHPALYTWHEAPTISLVARTTHPEVMAVLVKVLNDWGYNVSLTRESQPLLWFPCPAIFYQPK